MWWPKNIGGTTLPPQPPKSPREPCERHGVGARAHVGKCRETRPIRRERRRPKLCGSQEKGAPPWAPTCADTSHRGVARVKVRHMSLFTKVRAAGPDTAGPQTAAHPPRRDRAGNAAGTRSALIHPGVLKLDASKACAIGRPGGVAFTPFFGFPDQSAPLEYLSLCPGLPCPRCDRDFRVGPLTRGRVEEMIKHTPFGPRCIPALGIWQKGKLRRIDGALLSLHNALTNMRETIVVLQRS